MGYDNMEMEEGGKFLKLKSGETVDIHILDREPKKIVVHWSNNKKVVCLGDKCASCRDGDKPKQRWQANVWDRKEKKVKILEFGPAIAKQIRGIAQMLSEDGQDIHTVDLRIKTDGAGLDTEYTVIQKQASGEIPDSVELWELK